MLLAGCGSDDKDEPEPVIEPEADYTVILYGCGGGDLDHALRYNLDQVAASGYSPKVQFTALVKFSADQQENEGMEGTIRYTMEEEGMTHERVNDANFRLDNPDHLAGLSGSRWNVCRRKSTCWCCGTTGAVLICGINHWICRVSNRRAGG